MIVIFSCSFCFANGAKDYFRTFGLSACLLNRVGKKRETKHHACACACVWTEQTAHKGNELACLTSLKDRTLSKEWQARKKKTNKQIFIVNNIAVIEWRLNVSVQFQLFVFSNFSCISLIVCLWQMLWIEWGNEALLCPTSKQWFLVRATFLWVIGLAL